MSIHQQKVHPAYVDGCFMCRVSSVSVAPSAMPTRNGGAEAVTINAREARWQKDMPAYKRLRQQGYQPPRIDGCAELETGATTEHEVVLGKVAANPTQLSEAADIFGDARGHKFTDLQTAPKPAPVVTP